MRVTVFWTRTLPEVFPFFVREAKKSKPAKHKVCLQIEPELKTAQFSEMIPDEVLRAKAFDSEYLEKWISRERQHNRVTLVFDTWALLVSLEFEKALPALVKALECASECFVISSPELCDTWRTHAIYAQASHHEKNVFSQLALRTRQLKEAFLNASCLVTFYNTPPTNEFFLSLIEKPKIELIKKFGLELLPDDCREHSAVFSSDKEVATQLLKDMGLVSGSTRGDSWVRHLNGEINFDSVDLGASFFSKGVNWKTYLKRDDFENHYIPGGAFVSRSEYAKWVYFLAVLEKQKESSSKENHSQKKTLYFSGSDLFEV